MRRQEDSIRARVTVRTRCLLIVSLQPLIVVGSGTFLAELIEYAGGQNLAAGSLSTYPTFSREAVVAGNPDVLLVMTDTFSGTAELLQLFPEWATLKAVLDNRVFPVDSDILSRPGPRASTALAILHQRLTTGLK
jgi:iron complex transport system substrate-binding protein